MRKYKRGIAHYKMEREGIKHINKTVRKRNGEVVPSFFSQFWKTYVTKPLAPKVSLRKG